MALVGVCVCLLVRALTHPGLSEWWIRQGISGRHLLVLHLSRLSSSPFYPFSLAFRFPYFWISIHLVPKTQSAVSQCRNVKLQRGSTCKGYKKTLSPAERRKNAARSSRVNEARAELLRRSPRKAAAEKCFIYDLRLLLPPPHWWNHQYKHFRKVAAVVVN